MKILLVTTVAVCLCALPAAAQTQPVFHDEGGLLAKIQQVCKGVHLFSIRQSFGEHNRGYHDLQTPSLAPLVQDLRDNPGTVISLFQSDTFQQLAADPPTALKLLGAAGFFSYFTYPHCGRQNARRPCREPAVPDSSAERDRL